MASGEEMRRQWRAGAAELSAEATVALSAEAAAALSVAAELSAVIPSWRLGKRPAGRRTSF
jgi:hypothetical protein